MTIRPWGCPKCGCLESLVDETSRDADGVVVRIRRCNALAGCDGKWETEERVMAPGSFWARAYQIKERMRAHLRRTIKPTCHVCGAAYPYGSWSLHIANSRRHAAAVKPSSNRTKDRRAVRVYQRQWKRRKDAA